MQRRYYALLLAMLVVVHCRGAQSSRKAEEIWLRHESVLVDLSAGKTVNVVDFKAAREFFYSLTGIEVPADHSPMIDILPTRDSKKALEPLREWYSKNHERLFWDETSHSVQLLPRGRGD